MQDVPGVLSVLISAAVCWQLLSLGEHNRDPDETAPRRRTRHKRTFMEWVDVVG